MNRYKVLKALGDGTYGAVSRAQNRQTGETVAIKKFKQKYRTWDECIKLREVASLRKLIHPNIVKLKEVIRENDELHLVFEHMDANLYEYIKGRTKKLPESTVRNLTYQTLQALHHVHKNGYFHRDLKPENLLVRGDVVKLADFGLAREIRARPPFTDYVSTRWYRAPEVLLRSSVYNSPVDLFAVGAIIAELYNFRPLFPGSSETDQLNKICSVFGTPSQEKWQEGHKLAAKIGFRFPTFVPTRLETLVPDASDDAVNLMYGLMPWDPSKRFSTAKCLQHSYFEAGGFPSHAPSEQTIERVMPPKGSAAAAQKDFPGNFLLNNLNNTKGSCKDSLNGSNPNTRNGRPSLGKDGSKPNSRDGQQFSLPPLQQERQPNSGNKSAGSRYLRMARYQPGMQQLPTPRSQAPSNLGMAAPSRQPLPDLARQPPGVGQGVFAARAARMF